MEKYNEFKYKVISETKDGKTKQLYWNIAFGLQDVDNIKPSEYMLQLAKENVEGKKILLPAKGHLQDTLTEMEQDLQSSISYAGGRKVADLKHVDYVIVKNSIWNGDSH